MDALIAKLKEEGFVGDEPLFPKEVEPTPVEWLDIMHDASYDNCHDNRLKFLSEVQRHKTSYNPNPAIMFLIYDGKEMKKGTKVLVEKCPHYKGTNTNENPNSLLNSIAKCSRYNAEDYHRKFINGVNDDIFYGTVYDVRVDGRWDEIDDDVPRHATLNEQAQKYSKQTRWLQRSKGAGAPQYVVWPWEDGKVKREGGALAKYTVIKAMKESIKRGRIGRDIK